VPPVLVAPWVLLFIESGTKGAAESSEDVVVRAVGLIGLWEVTPFSAKPFRLAIALTLVVAAFSLGAYLIQRMRGGRAPGSERRAGRRTQLLLLLALGCLFTFLVAPTDINDAYDFNVRFAIGAVLFLILAASGTTPIRGGGRWQLVVLSGLSLLVVGIQVWEGQRVAEQLRPVLHAPPVEGARIGVLVEDGHAREPGLGFNPYHWAGAHYLRRSGVMMLNSPWMDNPIMLLKLRRPSTYGSFDPREVVAYLETRGASKPSAPEADLLVETRHLPGLKPSPRLVVQLKARGMNVGPLGGQEGARFGLALARGLARPR